MWLHPVPNLEKKSRVGRRLLIMNVITLAATII
jgi:hypothetical protein